MRFIPNPRAIQRASAELQRCEAEHRAAGAALRETEARLSAAREAREALVYPPEQVLSGHTLCVIERDHDPERLHRPTLLRLYVRGCTPLHVSAQRGQYRAVVCHTLEDAGFHDSTLAAAAALIERVPA